MLSPPLGDEMCGFRCLLVIKIAMASQKGQTYDLFVFPFIINSFNHLATASNLEGCFLSSFLSPFEPVLAYEVLAAGDFLGCHIVLISMWAFWTSIIAKLHHRITSYISTNDAITRFDPKYNICSMYLLLDHSMPLTEMSFVLILIWFPECTLVWGLSVNEWKWSIIKLMTSSIAMKLAMKASLDDEPIPYLVVSPYLSLCPNWKQYWLQKK